MNERAWQATSWDEARAELRDQAQLFAGAREYPAIDAIGNRRHQNIGVLHGGHEFLDGERLIVGVEFGVEQFLEPRLDRIGETARNDDFELFR